MREKTHLWFRHGCSGHQMQWGFGIHSLVLGRSRKWMLLSLVRGYTAHQIHSGMYVIRLRHTYTGHPMLFWVGKLASLLRKISPCMSLRTYIYISYT